jgi:FlaA1/EpsC-like NDP-sugar epimerase
MVVVMDSRILIVGHGTAGKALAADITQRGGTVVGFLDDVDTDPVVLGTLAEVNDVVAQHDVDLAYFAIPSVDASTVRDFINSVDVSRVDIAIIPRTHEILTRETVDINDLTDVDVLDLVGRKPVKHDVLSAQAFVRGKRVLVTGAAGSIGSRLVKQLAGMGAEVIVCVDWWENGIFFLSEELKGSAASLEFHIADIKNDLLLTQLFERYRPQVVFHAAAYKHVPLMQANPIEAVNNNVWGTLNLMQLATRFAVDNFIYVSTDKAVNPVNVMGTTKRIGEMMMQSIAADHPRTAFNAVRFGNVIESNGSVMQTFRSQISKGLPLTVTHPDITRFFMTIDEASHLVIQSAIVGEAGDIFVLDMGEPVKIIDLATSLIHAVDPSLSVEFVGLRPGEKMFEELSYEPDKVTATPNSKIFVVSDAQDFDTAGFMSEVHDLLEATRSYAIGSDEAVDRLRSLGFAIQ